MALAAAWPAAATTAERSTPSSGACSSGSGGFTRPRSDPRHYSWSPGGAIHTGLRRFKLPINQIRNELDEKVDLVLKGLVFLILIKHSS